MHIKEQSKSDVFLLSWSLAVYFYVNLLSLGIKCSITLLCLIT